MAFTTLVILSGVADKFNKEIDTDNYVILKNRAVSIYENVVAFIFQNSLMFTQCSQNSLMFTQCSHLYIISLYIHNFILF